jgi:protoporphyrinogen oxidase
MKKVAILGAGPAGLTSAYLLSRSGYQVTLFEKHASQVGGLAKTVRHKGYRFDIGGHRFLSQSLTINNLWKEIYSGEMPKRPRSSRIFFKGQFFRYPLQFKEIMRKFNFFKNLAFVLSFIKSWFFYKREVRSLEEWLIKNFGDQLYRIFFKTYSEKVWGRCCKDISADWANQRIKGLSLAQVCSDIFGLNKSNSPKSLTKTFFYPNYGPGEMWEKCKEKVELRNGKVFLGFEVTNIKYTHNNSWDVIGVHQGNVAHQEGFDHVICSIPLGKISDLMTGCFPSEVQSKLQKLEYRAFITVAIMYEGEDHFDDNWIYIHDSSLKVARIQNYKRWSPYMVPDSKYTCYGLEFFCDYEDDFWKLSDRELFAKSLEELELLKLRIEGEIDFKVIRIPFAYPVYTPDYLDVVEDLKNWQQNQKGLHFIGRCGLHRYDNQDNAMASSICTVANIIKETFDVDVWEINVENHEQKLKELNSFIASSRVC